MNYGSFLIRVLGGAAKRAPGIRIRVLRQRGRALHGVLAASMVVAFVIAPRAAFASDRIVVDDLGFRVAVQNEIRRVVSLVPSNSEMVCLLDCDRLKGGTRYDFFPATLAERVRLKQIEIIGGGFDANLEKVVQLRPDLILTNGPTQQRFAVPLRNLGFSVLSLWPRDLDGLKRDFLLLGELLEQKSKAASMIDEMQRRFATIETRTKNTRKKKVYLQMWSDPLITVGKSSFPDWLVAVAGGINVFGDLPFDSGQISLEALIQRDPDVLIFLSDQKEFVRTVARRPGWSAIRGVRESHLCLIEEPDIRRSIDFLGGLAKIQNCLSSKTAGKPAASAEIP